ncbi:AAA family ATPase [Winogradskyella vincentii]|uniref:AAA family ATPase n=1 Tax=Winogradskyella vincentii TaxID=2877122 RepID=A0ABS7XXA8_9FLAO|nr:AAA family ATPase [Winogradskyella vincentii]MCA0151715.1 AAA family ATPase [Winogradskyella vincentii]
MTIKEVTIENYLCYYGIKKFNLADGLNILLGENGEGKTKFFEALEWLFSNNNDNLELLVSKKALDEKVADESFRVRVEIIVEHFGETKILSKEFSVTKTNDNEYDVGKVALKGIEESNNGERSPVDGKSLLEQLFPSEIRRYSMFKGEEELNIFDNDEALGNLIKLFSDARYYDKYEDRGEFLLSEAEKAVNRESKNNTKNQKEYKRLEENINYFKRKKNDQITFLNETTDNIEKTKKNIQEVEKFINNAEALETINKRIRKIEDQISKTESLISENYTTSLFDENWILMNFKNIQKEFSEKVSSLSKEKRKLQSKFDRELGIKEGEKKARLEIINDLVPLPMNVPSLAIMEEMVNEKVCKVCNRPAPEGSEALEFMRKRLENYINSQEVINEEEEQPEKLFQYNYMNRLVNLSTNQEDEFSKLNNIQTEIRELFKFNQERKNEVANLKIKLEHELEQRNKIIGNSTLGSERLGVVLKDYNMWQNDVNKLNEDAVDYKHKIKGFDEELKVLEAEKEKIDLSNANTFLINTRNILRDIDTIFRDTKDRKFEEFIQLLSQKSNQIFSKINVDAFTGIIDFKLVKTGAKIKVKIQLQEEDGSIFYSPNQSLLTSMHISILLAISELSKEVRDDKYPMLFDAPTSSFGESKMTEFLNLIYETDNQTIILIKDYLAKDEDKNLYVKPEFDKVKRDKAFWVKLERPFDEKNLKTINTKRIEL